MGYRGPIGDTTGKKNRMVEDAYAGSIVNPRGETMATKKQPAKKGGGGKKDQYGSSRKIAG
jgi:hypothetical protein